MIALSTLHGGWLKAAEAIPGAPGARWAPAIALAAAGTLRLLTEWQQRRTLTAIFRHAPGGSVIVISKRGPGGTMRIQVGAKPAPPTIPALPETT